MQSTAEVGQRKVSHNKAMCNLAVKPSENFYQNLLQTTDIIVGKCILADLDPEGQAQTEYKKANRLGIKIHDTIPHPKQLCNKQN